VRWNAAAWGNWLPEASDEKAKLSAASMEEVFPKREHIVLTPDLVLRCIDKNPKREVLSLKQGRSLDKVIWKNGLSRSGRPVSADHLSLRLFFERIRYPALAE